MIKKVLLWLLPVLILLVGFWGARHMLDTRREVTAETLPSMVAGDPGDFATITTQAVDWVSAAPELTLFGQLQPLTERTLRAPISGLLTAVSIRPGQRVAADEVLLRFDEAPLERALRQAELALAQAQRQLERNTQLLARNAITDAELADAQTQRDQAQLNLESAQAALNDATVRAPFAGVVQQVMVQTQDRVGPNEPLLHLVATDRLEVVALLPVQQVPVLSAELAAQIDLGSGAQRPLQLERWEPVQVGGSIRLYFSGELADQVSGTFFPLALTLPAVAEVIQLPLRALYDNQFVYRVDAEQQLERIRVEVLGFRGQGEQQQVLLRSASLQTGDPILTTRLRNATEGLPVLVQELQP